ncbi:UNVERIFIED_CONTAM: hypothetical protein GTU68_065921 [Idotea baltica]|nr:hypothetical protein [Idotea baltica]
MALRIGDEIEIKIVPSELSDEEAILRRIQNKSKSKVSLKYWRLKRRSIDARASQTYYLLRYVYVGTREISESFDENSSENNQNNIRHGSAIVIGSGPAGLFAALELLRNGIKPIILERGKNVRDRRRDLKAIQQNGIVHPHSNYCFGEGGAGTYSDGKLYTRSKKRGSIEGVLKALVHYGAPSDILIDAQPHIGSNKLPKIIAAMREDIIQNGGEIHFESFVYDLIIENRKIRGVITADGRRWKTDHVILATGHSARDIFYLLDNKGVKLYPKSFALGLRIEHPQSLIDQIQYNQKERDENLPAAYYKLTAQVEGNGVFSFCMCPGGLIVPAATEPGQIVVNGMSLSRRDSAFANSGVVTQVEDWMIGSERDPFCNLRFQEKIERDMFDAGDGSQRAPAQRVVDFIAGRLSASLPETSYIPGIFSARLDEILPPFITFSLRKGLQAFDRKMRGYVCDQAVVVGVESRTSSPVKIPRDDDTLMSPDLYGLYPCGEGGGYAGGIMSAALDGERVARKVAEKMVHSS